MPTTCPNCGHGTDRREQFCAQCGAFLGWDQGQPAESQVFRQDTPRPDATQHAAVQLQLKSDLIKVVPGSAESAAFSVKNLGTQVEQFRVLVAGPEWLTVEPAAMSVYPGQEGTGTIQAAPPRTPGSAAGAAPFRLTVTSAVHAQVSGSASGRVDVAPFYELAAELVPASTSGRGTTRHQLRLDNRGNAPLSIPLHPADVADGLRVGVPAYADTWPGRVTEVAVPVYAARRWLGRPESKPFAIIADAPKPLAATRLPGTRIVSPVLPGWLPAVAGAAAAVVTAAALLIPKLTHQTTPPPPPTSAPATVPQVATTTGPPQGGSTSPTSPTTPAQSTTAQSTPASTPPSTPAHSTTPVTPVTPAAINLITTADSATWTSNSPAGQLSTSVETRNGCQANAAGAGLGAIYTLNQVQLANGDAVQTALETDPPEHESATVDGVYTFPATVSGEVFRAYIGFCSGGTPTAQMGYDVTYGPGPSQSPLAEGTISAGSSQLTYVNIVLATGTTQLELVVQNDENMFPYGDVVWIDPIVESGSASPPPSPAPSPTALLSATPSP
jgi:hypothetical protein